MEAGLQELLNRYESVGIMQGNELLLSPKDALYFLTELEEFSVDVLGVDLWYIKGELIGQEPASMDLSNYAVGETDRFRKKRLAIENLITSHLPERVRFVSFVLDI